MTIASRLFHECRAQLGDRELRTTTYGLNESQLAKKPETIR